MPRSYTFFRYIGILSLIASIWILQDGFNYLKLTIDSSTLALLTIGFVLFFFISTPIREKSKIRGMYGNVMRAIRVKGGKDKDTDSNRSKFFYAFNKLKADGIDLRNYPVLVTLGHDPEDVEKLISHARLTPAMGAAPIKPIKGIINDHTFRWWVAKEALIVDLSPSVSEKAPNDEDKLIDWNRITPVLKQLGDNIVDGVIVVVATDDVVDESIETKRVALKLRAQLNAIASTLNDETPVYFFANRVENVEGFKEYFSYCSGKKSDRSLGFNNASGIYLEKYKHMLTNLYRKLPSCISAAPTKVEKIKINMFPHSLATMAVPLQDLVFSILNDKTYLRVSGLYFTSVGSEYPFSEGAIKQVIRNLKKTTQKIEKSSTRMVRAATLTLTGLAFAAWTAVLVETYRHNLKTFEQTTALLKQFSETPKPKANDFVAVLKYLDVVEALSNIGDNHAKGLIPRVKTQLSVRIKDHLKKFYLAEVNRIYPAALLRQIERFLITNEITGIDAYKALGAYLGLKRFKDKDRVHVAAYFTGTINMAQNMPKVPSFYRHFRALQAGQVQASIKLNHLLVNELRGKIDRTMILKMLDKSIVRQISKVRRKSIKFSSLFITDIAPFIENINSPEIPYLYTKEGYNLFVSIIHQTLVQFKKDSWVLRKGGYSDKTIFELQKQLLSGYIERYVAFWRATMNGVRLKQLKDKQQASSFLNMLKHHPDYFITLADFALTHLNAISLRKYVDPLISEIKHLKKQSKILPWSKYISEALKKNDKTTIAALISEMNSVKNKDGKANTFFAHFAGQLQIALYDGDREDIVSDYRDTVYTLCQKVKGRYPFNTKAKYNTSLSDFYLLFGEKGRIEKFFKDQLGKYVTKDLKINQEGKVIGLNQQVIELLLLARKIRKTIFYKNRISIKMTLEPKLVDTRATQFALQVGRHKHIYRHAATQPERFVWPGTSRRKGIRVSFFVPGQKPSTRRISGKDWSFFRIIDRSMTKKGPVVFRSGGYRAEYSISVVNRRQYRTFKKLTNDFACPTLLK